MKIYALHGFLGAPSDWNRIADDTGLSNDLIPVDLLNDHSDASLEDWGKGFNRSVRTGPDPLASNLLIGYSLGGRLALHALIDDPSLWAGAVILSAHPGLATENERRERIAADERWAERIATEPWDRWIGDWNAQEVFRNDPPKAMRPMGKEDCLLWSWALRRWSLGKQKNMMQSIASIEKPILWAAGENDVKFSRLAGKMKLKHPASKVVFIEGAGHRLPLNGTSKLTDDIARFIKTLSEGT